jgi:hypothetical protein
MRSIVSYQVRGPFGRSDYPGNCTGFLVRDLIRQFDAKSVCDPMEGSGTTGDVCRALKVRYVGLDLRNGFNLLAWPLSNEVTEPVDLVFLHPPYFRIIPYSGAVWGKYPHPFDLSHETDWSEYLRRLQQMLRHALAAVAHDGRLAVLIGDVRQNGQYYCAQSHLIQWFLPDQIETVLIKEQHNVRSDRKSYTGEVIRIMHEYCVVIRPNGVRRG